VSDRYIHYLGFIGDSRRSAITVAITRGTSKSDVLFLLTKVIQSISRTDLPESDLDGVNEVRIAGALTPAGE